MLLSLVALSFFAQAAQVSPLECGNVTDAQTTPLRSPSGTMVVFKIHTEDDHAKNAHLCQADFSIVVTSPNGSTHDSSNFMGSDDAWGRPILAMPQGFSPNSTFAYFLVVEGVGKNLGITAIEYDLRSFREHYVYLSYSHNALLRGLPTQCVGTLRLAGTTVNGRMVLATSRSQECQQESYWELTYEQRALKSGGTVFKEPIRIPSSAGIKALNPGTALIANP